MGSITEVKEADSDANNIELSKDSVKIEKSDEPLNCIESDKSDNCIELDKPIVCNGTNDQKETIIQSTVSVVDECKSDKALISPADIELNDDDEDEDEDETIVERLIGLAEMFPESLRNGVSFLSNSSLSLIKGTYSLSRQVVWLGVSTSVILFAPVMFELERYNVEEMVKQDRNRLVLGPGSAMSGSPGMAPAPSR